MKKLTDKTIEDIVNIILPYPATRVMQISDGQSHFDDEIKLTQRLFELIQEREYDFQLNLLNNDKLEEYKERFSLQGLSSVRPLHPKQPRYGMQGKFYDYLYVTADIEDAMLEEFIKKVYEVIKSEDLSLPLRTKISKPMISGLIYSKITSLLPSTPLISAKTFILLQPKRCTDGAANFA